MAKVTLTGFNFFIYFHVTFAKSEKPITPNPSSLTNLPQNIPYEKILNYIDIPRNLGSNICLE